MSSLMEQSVDWAGWAKHAPERECPACGTRFAPNHPRRRFCGRSECPGRQRRRNTAPPAAAAPRPRRKPSSDTVYSLVADAMIDTHTSPPDGTAHELVAAAVELVRGVRASRPPAAERALTVRLLSIAAARAAQFTR
jgi:hypothetical protein